MNDLDEDEIQFLVEHDEDMKSFIITISTAISLSPEDLTACLRGLASDIEADPNEFLRGFSAYNFDCH